MSSTSNTATFDGPLPAHGRLRLSTNTILDLMLFGVTFLGGFQIAFMGEILLSDLVVVPLTIVALVLRGIPPKRLIYLTLAGGMIWVLALVASDIVNHTAANNYLRGWARNGLGVCYLAFFLATLRPTPRSFTVLAVSVALTMAFHLLFLRYYGFMNLMKFGIADAVTLVICAAAMWSWRARQTVVPLVVLFTWTCVILSQNIRSTMVINVITMALMAGAFYGRNFFRRTSIPVLLAAVVVGGAAAGAGIAAGYGSLASSGALGRQAELKYRFQTRAGGTLEQIWNARPELRVAIRVIGDSPIIGHGSWYHDPKIAAAELLFSGYVSDSDFNQEFKYVVDSGGMQASGHSVLLQAWVESGILGALFWLWVLGICIAAILRGLRHPTVLSPLMFLAAALLIWDTLFSPFANTQRVTNMAELAIVLVAMTASGAPGRPKRSAVRTGT